MPPGMLMDVICEKTAGAPPPFVLPELIITLPVRDFWVIVYFIQIMNIIYARQKYENFGNYLFDSART